MSDAAYTPTQSTLGEPLDIDAIEQDLRNRITVELEACTAPQRMMFTLVYDDGQSIAAASRRLRVKPNTGRTHLASAEARIWRSIAMSLVRERLDELPEATTSTMRADVLFGFDSTDVRTRDRRHTNNDSRIQLGTGSEHVMRVTEGGTGNRRMSQPHEHIIRTHTENIGRGEYTPTQLVQRYCK